MKDKESKRMMKAIKSKSDFDKKTSSKHSSVKGGKNPKYNAFDVSKERMAKPRGRGR